MEQQLWPEANHVNYLVRTGPNFAHTCITYEYVASFVVPFERTSRFAILFPGLPLLNEEAAFFSWEKIRKKRIAAPRSLPARVVIGAALRYAVISKNACNGNAIFLCKFVVLSYKQQAVTLSGKVGTVLVLFNVG